MDTTPLERKALAPSVRTLIVPVVDLGVDE
jgi:hypothetical protein